MTAIVNACRKCEAHSSTYGIKVGSSSNGSGTGMDKRKMFSEFIAVKRQNEELKKIIAQVHFHIKCLCLQPPIF